MGNHRLPRRLLATMSLVASALVASATALGVRAGLGAASVTVMVVAIALATVTAACALVVLSVLRDREATDNLVRIVRAVRAPSAAERPDERGSTRVPLLRKVVKRVGDEPPAAEAPATASDPASQADG